MRSFFKVPQHKRFDYKPLYYDKDVEERQERRDKRIKLEKGSFYRNKSQISGAFSDKEYVFRKRTGRSAQLLRTVLLTAMMFVIFALFLDLMPKAIAIGLLCILLLFFIRNINKM